MIYGYARVSTDGQSVDTQMKQLRAAGAEKVLPETASGAKTDRAQLRRAVDQLGNGDVLMVTRLETGWRDQLPATRAFVRSMTHGPTRRPRTGA